MVSVVATLDSKQPGHLRPVGFTATAHQHVEEHGAALQTVVAQLVAIGGVIFAVGFLPATDAAEQAHTEVKTHLIAGSHRLVHRLGHLHQRLAVEAVIQVADQGLPVLDDILDPLEGLLLLRDQGTQLVLDRSDASLISCPLAAQVVDLVFQAFDAAGKALAADARQLKGRL